MAISARQYVALVMILGSFVLSIHILWNYEFKHYLLSPQNEPLIVNSFQNVSFLSDKNGKPIFLHFFSEDCLNARINLDHLPSLTNNYHQDFDIYVIHQGRLSETEFKSKYNLPSYYKVLSDQNGAISRSLNVRTVPHSLIIRTDNTLFFSGNYLIQNNLCGSSDITGSAPAIALKFFKNNNNPPHFPITQLSFRGCQIN